MKQKEFTDALKSLKNQSPRPHHSKGDIRYRMKAKAEKLRQLNTTSLENGKNTEFGLEQQIKE
jgi:hypothetical protein